MYKTHRRCRRCCGQTRCRCVCTPAFAPRVVQSLLTSNLFAIVHDPGGLLAIDLSFVHGFTDASLTSLAKHCPNLRQVVILETSFGFVATTELLRRCGKKLVDITLGACVHDAGNGRKSNPPKSHYAILASVAEHCPHLRSLDFSGDGSYVHCINEHK